ncbi:ABC-type proline/glycine betaine transport system permease subunit [Bradyrhizobium diazoefficiens]
MSLFTDPRWGEALSHLPDYLGNHVRVSLAALALGLAISLPLAILTRNRPAPRGILLALASIVQTVPGLALLALFYPLLLAAASLTLAWFGISFSAFGFLPAMLALALYSMLPVLRNGITGLNGIDPALIEAAEGVGMTARQSLVLVELPLALPVMMAGIRTAAVWVIGTATLSTPIGQTSLGNYIFAGLQTQNWVFVLFGCLASALLALAVDQLLGLIESGLRRRSRLRTGFGAVGIAALVAATLVPTMGRSSQGYVVGAKTFAEQYVLSALMRDRLQAAGLPATARSGLGSSVIFGALKAGDIDLYVDYSGTLWANQLHRTDIKPRAELLAELKTALTKENITLLGELGFENAYALVIPKKRAEALGIRTIADLAGARIGAVDCRRLRVLLAPRMGGAAKGLRPSIPRPAPDAAGFHVCGGRQRRGRRHRRLHQRRADREIRPRCARRSQARDPALRCDPAARTQARRQRAIAGRAQTAARQDRHRHHARGQFARQRQRREFVAGCGGEVAVGEGGRVGLRYLFGVVLAKARTHYPKAWLCGRY